MQMCLVIDFTMILYTGTTGVIHNSGHSDDTIFDEMLRHFTDDFLK